MKIVIYGAGAIGNVIGGLLFIAGHSVALIGRPGHVNTVNEKGLKLTTPEGTFALKIPAFTNPWQVDFKPEDVVFLCTKGQNTEEALNELKKAVTDIPVFCFQNGVRNEEIAAGIFSHVYGVTVRVGAVFLKDGEATSRFVNPKGWLVIGRYPKGDEIAESVAGKLRSAGFLVMLSPEVMPYKWGKTVENLANVIGAITDARGKEVDIVAAAARKELVDLLAEAGIRWVSNEDLEKELPGVNAPLSGALTVGAQGSTWQSLVRQQGSVETEFINGEVVRLAQKLGKKAPVNECLVKISLEMAANREKPGKYTPQQLLNLLGLSTN